VRITPCFLTAILAAFADMTILAAPGDLDLSFGNGGIVSEVITNIGHYRQPSSILVQPDGKILVSGQIDEYGDLVSFFLARYNSAGSLDSSFGENGVIVAPIDYSGEFVGADMALQPDGKIVTVGYQNYNSNIELAVNRYNSNGTLDTSFGTGGRAVTTSGAATCVALQPDGKIIVVGYHEPGFGVFRYNPDGSLDNSFGVGGFVVTTLGSYPSVNEVLVQPDGRIVAVGSSQSPLSTFIVRYTSDGSLDNAFGTGGKVTSSISDNAPAAALQPDGKIVASGYSYPIAGQLATTIVRYNANGSVDTGFGSNGIFTPDYRFFRGYGIAIQPDGKILFFGPGTLAEGSAVRGFAVLRLNYTGSLDTSFGSGGKTVTPIGSYDSGASAGTLQPDGKILALGSTYTYDIYRIAIVRYRGESPVLIAGRVTTPDGRGLRNATVSLIDSLGIVRTVTTGSFGYYAFDNVRAGESYLMGVSSKRYRFPTRSMQINDNLVDINFTGLE